MNDKELLKLLGINDTTITFEFDEDIQIAIEKNIDNYLKKIDEEREKNKRVDYLKQQHEEFKKKNEFVNMFNQNFVYGKLKNKLISDGFIYRCKFCWGQDVSGQYGKPIEKYNHKNH